MKVVAAFSLLVLAIALLGFGWETCAIEVAVVFCIVLIDRTASALVDRWGRGAAGEELVGEALDSLRERGWFGLHDVQLDHGNIDHVLIGPAGVFTIETKSHRGRLPARAIDPRMLKQAYAQAKSLERITGLRAVPLLVFSSAFLVPAVTRRDGGDEARDCFSWREGHRAGYSNATNPIARAAGEPTATAALTNALVWHCAGPANQSPTLSPIAT